MDNILNICCPSKILWTAGNLNWKVWQSAAKTYRNISKVQRLDKVILTSDVEDKISTSAKHIITFYQELNVIWWYSLNL